MVAGWHDGVTIDQFYLMVDGRIIPQDSSASLAFQGGSQRVHSEGPDWAQGWKWRRRCGTLDFVRGAGTHGDILNRDTEGRSEQTVPSSLSQHTQTHTYAHTHTKHNTNATSL